MADHVSHTVLAQIIGCFDADPTACFVVLDSDASRTMLLACVPLWLRRAIRLSQAVLVRFPDGDRARLCVAVVLGQAAAAPGSVQAVEFDGQPLRLLLERPLRLRHGKAELVMHPGGHMELPFLGVWASPDGTVRVPGDGSDTLH